MSRLGLVLGVLAALMASGGERAGAVTYTAIADGSWTNTGNWDSYGVPPEGSSADTINLAGYNLTWSGGGTTYLAETWTGAGSLTTVSGTTLEFTGSGNLASGWSGRFIADSGGAYLPISGSDVQSKTNLDVLLKGGTLYNHPGTSFYGKLAGKGEAAGNWSGQDFTTGSTVTPGTYDTNNNLAGAGELTFASGLGFSGGKLAINIFDGTAAGASDLKATGTGYPSYGVVTIGTGSLLDVELYDAGSSTGLLSWTILSAPVTLTDSAGWTSLTGVTFSNTSFFDGSWTDLGVSQVGQTLVVSGQFQPNAAVPEPGTLLLLGTGAVGLIGYIRRRRMS